MIRALFLHHGPKPRTLGADTLGQVFTSPAPTASRTVAPRIRRNWLINDASEASLCGLARNSSARVQSAQAMTKKYEWPLAQTALDHQVEHLQSAPRQCGASRGLTARRRPPENRRPLRRTGRVVKRPYADLWELLSEPVGQDDD